MAISQAIHDTVVDNAPGRRVERVLVRIGHMRQVVPETLEWAWTMLVDGTDMEAARLQIDHVPVVVRCTDCGEETTLDWPVLTCGACGRLDVDLVRGEELQIIAIDVAQEVT